MAKFIFHKKGEKMGSYVKNNLTSGEEILVEAKVSWISQLCKFFFTILFIIIGYACSGIGYGIGSWVMMFNLFVALMFLIDAFITVKTTELVMTNKRILGKYGFVHRVSCDIRLDKIESFTFSQGILARIFNYGNIIIKGSGGSATPFASINDPLNTNKKLNECLDKFHSNSHS